MVIDSWEIPIWTSQVLGMSNPGDCGRSGEKSAGRNVGRELASHHPPTLQPAAHPHRSIESPLRLSFAHEDQEGWLRSCCLSCAALSLSHSVSLPVPSLLLVFPEKKVQFQRSVNGECPSSS